MLILLFNLFTTTWAESCIESKCSEINFMLKKLFLSKKLTIGLPKRDEFKKNLLVLKNRSFLTLELIILDCLKDTMLAF